MSIIDQARQVLATHTGCVATRSGVRPFDVNALGSKDFQGAFAEIMDIEDGSEDILFVARRHDENAPRILPVDMMLVGLKKALVIVGTGGGALVYPPKALARKASAVQLGVL